MAATVGATLSGVTFPLRHAGLGPHQSSAGNEYFFGRDSVNTGTVEPHKATDPMTAFTAQTAKLMSSGTTTAIEAMATVQDETDPDLIHVITQIATGAVYYNSFNMATDAWTLTTSETAAAAASFAPNAGFTFVTLASRTNGNVVFGYCAGQTAMTSAFNMVRYRERTGTNTYSTATNVDNGGSNNWSNPAVALGASNGVHFFFANQTNSGYYQRTLSAANALQTFPAAFYTRTSPDVHALGRPESWVSGATTKVIAPFGYDSAGVTFGAVAMLDSADAPTVTTNTTVSDIRVFVTQSQRIHAVAIDGTTLHYLYSDGTTNDLYHDSSADGGTTWGTDAEEWDAATINRITANIYERPTGDKMLAMVVDDGGTIKYAEIDLPEQGFPFETNPIFRHVLSLR